jgi:hypothetical protein
VTTHRILVKASNIFQHNDSHETLHDSCFESFGRGQSDFPILAADSL